MGEQYKERVRGNFAAQALTFLKQLHRTQARATAAFR